MAEARRLVICSKSTWRPAVRREHAFAQLAAADGLEVVFLERPLDLRSLRTPAGARAWWRGVRARPEQDAGAPPGVSVRPTACLVPGHRDDLAERQLALALGALLRRTVRAGDVVVATTPWQWGAVSALRAPVRRAFDSADDWAALIPARAEHFRARCRAIGAQADVVLVVNEDMAGAFGGGDVRVLRNGVHRALVDAAPAAPREERRLVYVGTLSERFDAPLVAALMDALPGWRLDLYGPCQYPGRGDAPGDELSALLERHASRVAWHGVVARERLAEVLDPATVGLLPNRPERSRGQDAMKLYDYAARGLPVASTPWSPDLARIGPPALETGADAPALAAAVERLAAGGEAAAARQRAWAGGNTWDARWPAWRAALLGDGDGAAATPAA